MRRLAARAVPGPIRRLFRLERPAYPPPFRNGASREQFFAAAAAYTGHLSVEIDEVTFVVSAKDIGVGEDIFSRAVRPELIVLPRALQVLEKRLARLSYLIDVGANIGTTAIIALRRHGFGEAVACEPSPENAVLLRANCALNRVEDRIRVIEAAVSDTGGSVVLDVSKSPGAHQVARQQGHMTETITVPAVTLDNLAARGIVDPPRVDLLWIDAQGHEGHVLAGAHEILSHRPPLVVAVRRTKLDRAGTREQLVETLEHHYDRIVDLRAPGLRDRHWRPVVRPVADICKIIDLDEGTDVLALADRR